MLYSSIQLQHFNNTDDPVDNASLRDPILENLSPRKTDSDARCPDLDGRNEWLQYLRWVAQLPEVTNLTTLSDILYVTIPFQSATSSNNVQDYNYDVKYTMEMLNSKLLFFKVLILQSHDDTSANVAGSNYRVEVTTDDTRQVCGVKDMNNGKYLSCCQISLWSNPSTTYQISVFVHFVNFRAFKKSVSNNTLIWSRELSFADDVMVLNQRHNIKHDNNISLDTNNNVCDITKPDWVQGFWNTTTNPDAKYIVSDRHCTLPHITNSEFKECIQSKYNGSFTAIGDSHMRALYYYLVNVTTGVYRFIPTLRIDMDVNNMDFKWITTCETLEEKLQAYLLLIVDANNQNPLQQHLLIFDILAWDLMLDDYHTVSTRLPNQSITLVSLQNCMLE